MFCKYCGKQMKGTSCDSCGSSPVFQERSDDLAKWMSAIPSVTPKSEKGDFQSGLAQGYENGLRDGKAEGRNAENALWQRRVKIGLISAIVICLLLCCVSSVISYRWGFGNGESAGYFRGKAVGTDKGRIEGHAEARQEIEREKSDADAPGESEGFDAECVAGLVERVGEGIASVTLSLLVTDLPDPEQSPSPIETKASEPEQSPSPTVTNTPEPEQTVPPTAIPDDAVTAQNKKIQERLRELGLYNGRIDGILGPMSKAAVRAFQKANGLAVDGDVGPETLACLFPLPETPTPTPSATPTALPTVSTESSMPAMSTESLEGVVGSEQ